MFGRDKNDQGGIPGLSSLGDAADRTGLPGSATFGSPAPTARPGGAQAAPSSRATASAGHVLRVATGWLLLLGSLGYAGWAIYELMSFGTCASGGPYVSTRECADGTGLKIVGITASVFVALIGVALIGSARGGLAAWALTFCGLGAMFLFFGFGPDSTGAAGEKLFGGAMGGMFMAMGLPALWLAVKPPTARERRQIKIRGAYGTELSVDTPQDGGPAPIVMARTSTPPR
jgi:hypothetical protein